MEGEVNQNFQNEIGADYDNRDDSSTSTGATNGRRHEEAAGVDLGVGSTSLDLSLMNNGSESVDTQNSVSSSRSHPTTATRLKPQVRKTRRHLRRKTVRQVMYGLLRNGLCYLFLIFVIVIAVKAEHFHQWDELEKVVFVALMGLGLVGGIPFQLVHARREFLYKSPTVVLQLLNHCHTKSQLTDLLRSRQMAAPAVKLKVSLKGGPAAVIDRNDPDLEWMRTTGEVSFDIEFDEWHDSSQNPSSIQWQGGMGSWLFVVTEYRLSDDYTRHSVYNQMLEYRKLTLIDKYNYFMDMQYLQQVKQSNGNINNAMQYAEVQPEMVLMKGEGMCFFTRKMYYLFLCLCLDSIYHLIFHLLIRRLRSYSLIKVLTRN